MIAEVDGVRRQSTRLSQQPKTWSREISDPVPPALRCFRDDGEKISPKRDRAYCMPGCVRPTKVGDG